MKKTFVNSALRAGSAPGTLRYLGKERTEPIKITVYEFDETQGVMTEISDVEECAKYITSPTVSWIKVVGIHNVDILRRIGEVFSIHPLVLEDLVNTANRPKYEAFENYLFMVTKVLWLNEKTDKIADEQISIIAGNNWVISFQEYERGIFKPLITRIMDIQGRIRKRGSDYLFYAIADTIVDHYFILFEQIDSIIEKLDVNLMTETDQEILDDIHKLKQNMVHIRRNIAPIRESVYQLMKDESPLINETTDVFIKDLYDHTIQAVDAVDSYREALGGMIDVYLSMTSFKMNEVMKVLTIIATIFIPLTFIAGIYGMNFDNMPELHWAWGYFAILVLMFGIGVALMFYFKVKKWF